MGFCSCSIKYLIFIFNFLVAICGIGLITIGALAYNSGKHASTMLEGKVTAPSIAIMVVGSIIFVIAFFGCCGAIQENACMVTTYGLFLVLFLILEVVLAVLIFVYQNQATDVIKQLITPTFDKYSDNEDTKAVVDAIQINFHCCGVDGPDYWGNPLVQLFKIPVSCCKNPNKSSSIGCEHWDRGCKTVIPGIVAKLFNQMGGICIAIAVVQLIAVIITFFLANHIRNEERRGFY